MCRKIFYLIKIHGQLININEVTDFDVGFLIFFCFKIKYIISTRWTTVLYRAHEYLHMRKKYLTIPLDFLTIFYLKNVWTTH